LHSWLCGSPTHPPNYLFGTGLIFPLLLKFPNLIYYQRESPFYSSYILTLFQRRNAPVFLKTLSYQENIFTQSLVPFYFNYVYVVDFRCPQNDRTHCVTGQNGNAVLRMSLPRVSPPCPPYPGRKSAKKCKYCPNVRDQKQRFI
jgi:hypothetical protein